MEEQKQAGIERRQPEMMLYVNELSRMFHIEMRKVCEENGVPVGYRSLLFHLAHHNGCTQRDLAAMTGLKAPTVSIAIDKMERDGYITREKSSIDGRAVRVFLTEKGMDIDRKNKEKIGQLEKQFAATVSNEERHTLMKLIEQVISGYCVSQDYPLPAFLSADPGEKKTDGKEPSHKETERQNI